MPRPDPETTGSEFDWQWSFAFLGARAVTGVEIAAKRSYRRLVGTPPHTAELGFTARGPGVVRRLAPVLSPAVRRPTARHWFDLDRDLRPFHRLAAGDRRLAPLVRCRPGIRIPGRLDPFEVAVRAVVGQLISVAAATTVLGRLAAAIAAPVTGASPGLTRCFPTPVELAEVSEGRIAAVGLTRAKAAAIRTLASNVADHSIDFERLATLPGDECDRFLRAQPGIGPWTAGYLRLRGLGDPDVSLETDLAIAKALTGLGVPRKRHRAVIDRWRPWRSYAMLHLWASLA